MGIRIGAYDIRTQVDGRANFAPSFSVGQIDYWAYPATFFSAYMVSLFSLIRKAKSALTRHQKGR